MSWAKKKMRQWLAEDHEKEEYVNTKSALVGRAYPSDSRLEISGINFSVCKATGGYVVETRSYDPHTDRSKTKLHIITDEMDIGHEIGKIITMETLRHG
jgi:hypothetical protein